MTANGDCFVVMPANCAGESLIIGRNAQDESAVGVAQELAFYAAENILEGKTDGGAAATTEGDALRVILQKPKPGVWGGDFGANERNVTVAITWTAQEAENDSDSLQGTDIVRLTLAAATNAKAAIERIGALVAAHNVDAAKLSFIACDPSEAWLISCAGKVWAAQQLKESYQRVPSGGLAVTTNIDEASDGVDTTANFAAAFDAAPTVDNGWCGPTPAGDASYTQASMFETLRAAADANNSRSASVSVLTATGIACHWFTATPNASESVFKPFVFAPNPKVSPLTKVPADTDVTLLHKLHAQRKPSALDDLKALEAACVQELNNYLAEHPNVDEELDELLKDCVEAEVKFYR